ncbi:MAG: hypothetical protein M1825_003600 [Sarcosagium campestre]|nr:MAG: hypothetical protein M1825_003600 [Sarcosagium campestre]
MANSREIYMRSGALGEDGDSSDSNIESRGYYSVDSGSDGGIPIGKRSNPGSPIPEERGRDELGLIALLGLANIGGQSHYPFGSEKLFTEFLERSRRHGTPEFEIGEEDLRAYNPGDPLTHIEGGVLPSILIANESKRKKENYRILKSEVDRIKREVKAKKQPEPSTPGKAFETGRVTGKDLIHHYTGHSSIVRDPIYGWKNGRPLVTHIVTRGFLASTGIAAIKMASEINPETNDFTRFDHGHYDMVRTVAYNFYSDRIVTGSADHYLKVFNKQKKDGEWKIVDSWSAHDGEVTDVHWSTPFMGEVIGSISEDGKFKIWQEDEIMPLNTGQRFCCIFSLRAPNHSQFVSFDFKSREDHQTYLALLSRDATLSFYEASEPDSLVHWASVDSFHVCPPPTRGDDTGFKVQFDPNCAPCYTAIQGGVQMSAVSLVTAGMNTVKVWRADCEREGENETVRLFLAADLTAYHNGIVRSASWAPFNICGHDTIATASKDGYIRIFELYTDGGATDSASFSESKLAKRTHGSSQPAGTSRVAPSGIGAGLAGASRQRAMSSDLNGGKNGLDWKVRHRVKKVAEMLVHDATVWEVKWHAVPLGGLKLFSSGDDGKIRVWKENIEKEWVEYSVIETVPNKQKELLATLGQPQETPGTPPKLVVIDVRDDDYIGGHIKGSRHVPTPSLDARMPELIRTLKDVPTVVFHCSLSQQRGPTAALRYLRERPKQKSAEGTAEGEGEGKEEKKKKQEQKVYVLDGGFIKWQELYGPDERVTEGWVSDIWKDYFH